MFECITRRGHAILPPNVDFSAKEINALLNYVQTLQNALKQIEDLVDLDAKKQDKLTDAQQSAVDSGVTSTDVTNLASLITKVAAMYTNDQIDKKDATKADAENVFTKVETSDMITSLEDGINEELDNKSDVGHTHTDEDVTGNADVEKTMAIGYDAGGWGYSDSFDIKAGDIVRSIECEEGEQFVVMVGAGQYSCPYIATGDDTAKIGIGGLSASTTANVVINQTRNLKEQLADKANSGDVYTREEIDEQHASMLDNIDISITQKCGANKSLIDALTPRVTTLESKTVTVTGTYTGTEEVSLASLAQPVYIDPNHTYTLRKGNVLSAIVGYDDNIMVINQQKTALVASVSVDNPYTHTDDTQITVYFGIDEVSGHTGGFNIEKAVTASDIYNYIAEKITIK